MVKYILKIKYTDGTEEVKEFNSRQEYIDYIHHDHVLEVEIIDKITE